MTEKNENEFKIVVVASRHENDCYKTLLPQAIRLLDVLHHEDKDRKRFKFVHNGARSGPLNDLHKVLNVLENGMRGRGFYVQREQHKMDLILNGQESEAKWLEENAQNADAILVINDKKIKSNVWDVLNDLDIYTMEVKV